MNRLKLPEVCELIMGQSPNSTSYNKLREGLPFYQGNANFGQKYPTPTVWCSAPKKIAKNNDILISVRAPIGDLNFANEECCIGRGLAALRIKDNSKYSNEYIFAFLKSTVKELQRKGTGTTFTAIGKTVLENLEINVPTLPEQQKIARHLDTIQSAIDNKKQQLQQLDELVKSKFVEMFGDPIANEMNWTVKKLKETSKIITGNTPSRANKNNYGNYLEWIKTDNITENLFVTKALEYLSEQGEKKGRTVKSGAILMACIAGSLSSIGRVALTDRTIAFNQQINAIVPSPLYNSYFLYTILNLSKSYTQSTVQMALKGILSKGKLEELKYIVPPIDLQNAFAAFVQKIDTAKSIVKNQLADLNELLDSKMDEYFGE